MNIPFSRIVPTLTYLNVAAYTAKAGKKNDYSAIPRPHNCISLFVGGKAIFRTRESQTEVSKGDVVFVPWQSLYVSEFTEDSEYLTIHCNFAPSDVIFRSSDYPLQKIAVDFDAAYRDFSFMKENVAAEDFRAFEVMQRFYKTMNDILPRLKRKNALSRNERILSVIDFMENNYSEDFSCAQLAKLAAVSESKFYAEFKAETGVTPVEYKNHIRIRHAVNLLYENMSIEEITTELGFNSAAYFRKVFFKSTGYNPLEYKKKVLKR